MDKSEWEGGQGETWAREWRRTDRSFMAVTEKLLERTRGSAFTDALDIGCGAGELSLAIARGRPAAKVVGVDVSPPLVAAARERGANLDNVSFECADAASWSPDDAFAPQLLVSRHGVMFFADPPAAFGNLASIAQDDASLVFSCFRSPERNRFFADVAALLPDAAPPADPAAPGPFAFAERERIEAVLTGGGWDRIDVSAFDFPMVVGAGEDPIEDAVSYFCAIGPAARAIAAMADEERDRLQDGLRDIARRNHVDGIVAMPAAGWIVSARKA